MPTFSSVPYATLISLGNEFDDTSTHLSAATVAIYSEEEYERLVHGKPATPAGVSALQWLLSQPAGARTKTEIDADIQADRDAWGES